MKIPSRLSEALRRATRRDAQEELPLEKKLLSAFQHAIDVMERENALLGKEAVTEATELLSEKTERIEQLQNIVESLQEGGISLTDEIQAAQKHFTDAAERNQVLLKRTIETQATVTKILVDAASQNAQQGYGRTGEAELDATRAHFSLNSKA